MAAETTTVGDDKAQEVAWKDAGGDRSGMPPPTGDAVGSVDSEKDMIRGMAATHMAPVEEQRKAFRPPSASEAPEERPARPAREETFQPPAEREEAPRRAAAPPPVDDEGAQLERQIIGGETPGSIPEIPDTMVKIGGVEIPLNRVRSGLEALAHRDDWNASLTQKEQALARSNDLMVDAAREFQRDPVGAAEKIGIRPDRLLDELRSRGLVADGVAPTNKRATEIPDDADPLAKALHAENQALKRKLERYDSEIGGIKQHLTESESRQRTAALQSQQAAALSGVESELTAMAARMPSMQEAPGKLNPTGKLLVDAAMTRLRQEVTAYGQPVEAGQLKPRATTLFGTLAREVGVTPKTVQARNALSRQAAPTPIQTGTTVPMSGAAAEQSKKGQFDFSNDDARRSAMDAWWEANAAT